MRNPFTKSRRDCASLMNRRNKRRKHRTLLMSRIGLEPLEDRRLFAGDVVNAAISDLQIMPILAGMDGFANWATTLGNTSNLSAPLSLFTDEHNDRLNLGSVVDIGDVIAEQLTEPVRVYLESTAEVDRTTDGLVAVLDAIPGITFARGGLAADFSDEFTFEIRFQDQFQIDDVEFDFGSAAAGLGLSVQETHGVALSATLDLAFTFGVFVDPDLNVEQAFFVRDTQIRISADVHTSTATMDLNVGFLEVPSVALHADMDADVSITLNDVVPDDAGSVTLSELNGYPINETARITRTGDTLSASLELSPVVGAWIAPGAPMVTILGDALGDLTPTVSANSDFNELRQFNNLNPEQLLAGLELLGVWMEGFQASDILDLDIPFVEATLASALDIAASYSTHLDVLRDMHDQPAFGSLQSFVTLLDAEVDYDDTTDQLSFAINLDLLVRPSTAVVSLGSGVAELGSLSTNSRARITGNAEMTFELVVDLATATASLSDQVAVNALVIDGEVTQLGANLMGESQYGIVGIDFADGSTQGTSSFQVEIANPNTGSRLATLAELLIGLSSPDALIAAPLTLTGSSQLQLSGVSVPDIDGFGPLTGARYIVAVPDFGQANMTTLSENNTGMLASFSGLSLDFVLESISTALQSATRWSNYDVDALNVIRTTLTHLTESSPIGNYAIAMADGLHGGRIQDILSVVEEIVSDNHVSVSVDLSANSLSSALRLQLSIENVLDETIEVEVGLGLTTLAEAAMASGLTDESNIQNIGDFAGTGSFVLATVTQDVQLDLDFDLTVPDDPQAYLRDTSALTTGLFIDVDALTSSTMDGTLGTLRITIDPSSLVVAGDLNSPRSDNPASIHVGPDTIVGGRHALDTISGIPLISSATGQMFVDYEVTVDPNTLPESTHLQATIMNLGELTTSTSLGSAPNFQALTDDLGFAEVLYALPEGLNELLDTIADAADEEVFSLSFPVIGNKLSGPANLIRDVQVAMAVAVHDIAAFVSGTPLDSLEAELEAHLESLLISVLTKSDGASPPTDSIPDVDVDVDLSQLTDITINVRIDFTDDLFTSTVSGATNLGLPMIGASIDAALEVNVGYEVDLTFGISTTDGVYLDTSSDDLSVFLDVFLTGSAEGHLGFIQVDVTPTVDQLFHADFTIDLMDPSGDGRLTIADLGSARSNGLASLIDFSDDGSTGLTGGTGSRAAPGGVGLTLNAGIQDWLPSFETTLTMDWQFEGTDFRSGLIGSQPPDVTLEAGLNLGTFISGIVSPFVDGVQTVLAPIDPALDVLTAEIPLVSSFLGETTIASLATSLVPGGAAIEQLVYALDMIADISDMLDVRSSSDVVVDFGILELTRSRCLVLEALPSQCDARDSRIDVGTLSEMFQGPPNSPLGAIGDVLADIEAIITQAEWLPEPGSVEIAPELSFPIFDRPIGAFELLFGLGQPELVTFELAVDVHLPIDLGFNILPPFPLKAGIFGDFDVEAFLAIGYDTQGFTDFLASGDPADLANGFYVSDTANADGSGIDVPQIVVTGKALAEPFHLDVIIAEAGVGGGLESDLTVDFHDSDGDGKVRVLGNEPLCVIVDGTLDATLEAYYRAGPFRDEYPFAKKTLHNFGNQPSCAETNLAEVDEDGVLRLFVGRDASKRDVLPDEENEAFMVYQFNDEIMVSAFGATQSFKITDVDRVPADIQSIYADAGDGDDRIELLQPPEDLEIPDWIEDLGVDVWKNITLPATLIGGAGNDVLVGGDGPDTIQGRGGDDELYGHGGVDTITTGSGDNLVFGGKGSDVITGGSNRDVIYGESGNDTINVSGGDNYVDGGTGEDEITTGEGNDVIYAEADRDIVDAGDGENYVEGGEGDDEITAGQGNDTVHGGDGNDTILAGAGNDLLYGDAGIDTISGQEDDDEIHGGGDADDLAGGTGIDAIYGDGGGDVIKGGLGNDILFGDAGVDWIYGNDDSDDATLIAGVTDDDTMYGGPEGDFLFGNQGNDLIFGEGGDDVVSAGDGDDFVDGGAGYDTINGESGQDTLHGGNQDDTIDGGSDSDIVRGGNGNDTIFGQDGTDNLFGDDGDDIVDGGSGADFIDGGDDNDYLIGGGGPDEIYGNFGDDTLEGNRGNDILRGNNGDDVIYGDDGVDDASGGNGNDTIRGGIGNDAIRGGDGNDLLLGHEGADTIDGDAGDDVIMGYLGNDILNGGTGNDSILGEQDNDTIDGGDDDDILDGGSGDDTINGSSGNDQLYGGYGTDILDGGKGNDFISAGNGVGNRLIGGDGDDHIVGSDDGQDDPDFTDDVYFGDVIYGDNGIDGNDGNDTIQSLGGADIIDAGKGNDIIEGGSHGDFIVAGPAIITSGTDEDYIFGQLGDDEIFPGDGDDIIETGPGVDTVHPASGTNNVDTAIGNPTRPTFAVSQGPEPTGNWVEKSGSATNAGLTKVGGFEESIFSDETGVYVAWVDWRNGNSEIYLAFHPHDVGDWQQFNGSASDGGVSNDVEQSRRPTIAKADDGLVVAWTSIDEFGNSNIEVTAGLGWLRKANAGQTGTADNPQLISYSDNSVLLGWTDSAVDNQVQIAQYVSEGCIHDFLDQISAISVLVLPTKNVAEFDLASVANRAGIAMSFGSDGAHDIDIQLATDTVGYSSSGLCGAGGGAADIVTPTEWEPVSVGAVGGDDDVEPAIAYRVAESLGAPGETTIDIYVAWHRITDREDQVVAGVARQAVSGFVYPGAPLEPQYFGESVRSDANSVSDTVGYAAKPDLATSERDLYFAWLDMGVHDDGLARNSIFVMNASGDERVVHERLAGEASGLGISETGGAIQSLSVAVEQAKDAAYVAWTDASSGMSQVFLRHDKDGTPNTPPDEIPVWTPTGTVEGDVNADQVVNVADIVAVLQAVRDGVFDIRFDLDRNGLVDRGDVDYLIGNVLRTTRGDVDLDGKVDARDLNVIGKNWLASETTWSRGDLTGDGRTDALDLNLVGLHWRQQPAPPPLPEARPPQAPLAASVMDPSEPTEWRNTRAAPRRHASIYRRGW